MAEHPTYTFETDRQRMSDEQGRRARALLKRASKNGLAAKVAAKRRSERLSVPPRGPVAVQAVQGPGWAVICGNSDTQCSGPTRCFVVPVSVRKVRIGVPAVRWPGVSKKMRHAPVGAIGGRVGGNKEAMGTLNAKKGPFVDGHLRDKSGSN